MDFRSYWEKSGDGLEMLGDAGAWGICHIRRKRQLGSRILPAVTKVRPSHILSRYVMYSCPIRVVSYSIEYSVNMQEPPEEIPPFDISAEVYEVNVRAGLDVPRVCMTQSSRSARRNFITRRPSPVFSCARVLSKVKACIIHPPCEGTILRMSFIEQSRLSFSKRCIFVDQIVQVLIAPVLRQFGFYS